MNKLMIEALAKFMWEIMPDTKIKQKTAAAVTLEMTRKNEAKNDLSNV